MIEEIMKELKDVYVKFAEGSEDNKVSTEEIDRAYMVIDLGVKIKALEIFMVVAKVFGVDFIEEKIETARDEEE